MWLQSHTDNNYIRPCDAPLAKTVMMMTGPDADKENEQIFKQFMQSRDEFMLTVEHEVNIGSQKSTKASASSTAFVKTRDNEKRIRPFRRTFSVLGVALSMLSELCGVNNDVGKIQVLKFHSRSISVCYLLAICIKRMLEAGNEVLGIGEPVRGEDDLSVDSNPCTENIQAAG